jgi:hypothetical protein
MPQKSWLDSLIEESKRQVSEQKAAELFMYGQLELQKLPNFTRIERPETFRACWDDDHGWVVESSSTRIVCSTVSKIDAQHIADAMNHFN